MREVGVKMEGLWLGFCSDSSGWPGPPRTYIPALDRSYQVWRDEFKNGLWADGLPTIFDFAVLYSSPLTRPALPRYLIPVLWRRRV